VEKANNIYREVVGVYNYIGSVANNGVNEYSDTVGINPNATSYKYKISVVDTCGSESVLSNHHKTILLQVSLGIPPAINLSWNDYEGLVLNYYRILRDTTGLGLWEKLDSVSVGFNSYTDPSPPITTNLGYRIEAVSSNACISSLSGTPKSNIVKVYPTGINKITESKYFIVYPNPSRGLFTLEVDLGYETAVNIKLYDFTGQLIGSEEIGHISGGYKQQIDLSGFSEGVYIVQISTENSILTQKVILY